MLPFWPPESPLNRTKRKFQQAGCRLQARIRRRPRRGSLSELCKRTCAAYIACGHWDRAATEP